MKRGAVVGARVIGVLKLLDGGEQDDKLIAVADGTPFEGVTTLDELASRFPGVLEILELWISNYKGPGEMEFTGRGNAGEANEILAASIQAFAARK